MYLELVVVHLDTLVQEPNIEVYKELEMVHLAALVQALNIEVYEN